MVARSLKNIFLQNFTEHLNLITYDQIPFVDAKNKESQKVSYSDGDSGDDFSNRKMSNFGCY